MNETANSFPYLFWGYAAIWAIFGLYLFSLGRRVSRLESSRTEPSK